MNQAFKSWCFRITAGVVVACLAAAVVIAVNSMNAMKATETTKATPANPPTDDFSAKTGALYVSYVTGDAARARQSLLDAIELNEHADISAQDRAHGLFMSYARLHALEQRVGDSARAQDYLAKARQWKLTWLVFQAPQDESIAAVNNFSSVRCIEMVDHWDNRFTAGKGAAYLQSAPEEP